MIVMPHLNFKYFMDFPYFNGESNADGDFDNEVGVIVQDIEHNNHRLEDVEEDGAQRQALKGLSRSPKLNIWGIKSKKSRHLSINSAKKCQVNRMAIWPQVLICIMKGHLNEGPKRGL